MTETEWVGRGPHGPRGLKQQITTQTNVGSGRGPHGPRGLKLGTDGLNKVPALVAAHTGRVD